MEWPSLEPRVPVSYEFGYWLTGLLAGAISMLFVALLVAFVVGAAAVDVLPIALRQGRSEIVFLWMLMDVSVFFTASIPSSKARPGTPTHSISTPMFL